MCLFLQGNIFTAFDHANSSSHCFFLNPNIWYCKTLRRTQIHIMTSYYTITLTVKNTKPCLQSHQICVVFTIHKLLDAGAISSGWLPVYSLFSVTRNQYTHHIKVIGSVNSYALRSLPLNRTHKPQRDASHWNSTHNKIHTHKQTVNASFSIYDPATISKRT